MSSLGRIRAKFNEMFVLFTKCRLIVLVFHFVGPLPYNLWDGVEADRSHLAMTHDRPWPRRTPASFSKVGDLQNEKLLGSTSISQNTLILLNSASGPAQRSHKLNKMMSKLGRARAKRKKVLIVYQIVVGLSSFLFYRSPIL